MIFKTFEDIIIGYVNYFNFMMRTNVVFYKNKKFNEIEIREKNKDITKTIFNFYFGDIKSGVKVNININDEEKTIKTLFESKSLKKHQKSNIIIIKNTDELHLIFEIIEKNNILKKK